MSYERQFRGKRLDNGEWIYGALVKEFGGWSIADWGNRHDNAKMLKEIES